MAIVSTAALKIVGANGQISLGKQFAGRQVLIEKKEPGVWLIRTATVIPDNERWLHDPKAANDMHAALAWAQTNRPNDNEIDITFERLREEAI